MRKKSADLVVLDKIYNAKVGFTKKSIQNWKDIPEGMFVARRMMFLMKRRALFHLS